MDRSELARTKPAAEILVKQPVARAERSSPRSRADKGPCVGDHRPGATLAKSARAIIVTFRFVKASGQSIGSGVASALAAAGKVRASIAGPGITKKTATCTWNPTSLHFRCSIGTPSGVKTGSGYKYSITALENVGTGLIKAPAVGTATDPETVRFK